MKVFYSWQSDTSSKIGREFIHDALIEAATLASTELSLDESERIEVDRDTKGVLGNPSIAETILKKIKESDIVVVDVTLTGHISNKEEKKLINSNVAYELGFTHGFHDDEVTIAIMNTHYGSQKELPFDLAHRRWPINYELSPDADSNQINKKRSRLAKELAGILIEYVHLNEPAKEDCPPSASTYNKAAYWQEGESLVNVSNDDGHDGLTLAYHPTIPLCYLRVWPNNQLEEFSGKELSDYELAAIPPFCKTSTWTGSTRNKYGLVSYSTMNQASELSATTQVFKNREIWGVNSQLIRFNEDKSIYYMGAVPFEIGIIKSIREYIDKAVREFGYLGSANVEVGIIIGSLADSGGVHLAMPNNAYDYKTYIGPIYEDIIVNGIIDLSNTDSIKTFQLGLFNKLYDAAGDTRPSEMDQFHNMA